MIPEDRIAAIRAGYDRCFGCGPANPIGLGLDDFVRNEAVVTASFSPVEDFNGFAEVLHGGVVATALDEVMAWTAILVEGVMVVTGTLDLRFRKPAPVAATFDLRGELLERRGRRLMIQGSMSDNGKVVADANGMFLAVDEIA